MKRVRRNKEKTFEQLKKEFSEGNMSEDYLNTMIDKYELGATNKEETEFIEYLKKSLTPKYELPKRSIGAAVLYTHRWEPNIQIKKTANGVFFKYKKSGIKFRYPKGTCRMKKIHLNHFEYETFRIWQDLEKTNQWVLNIQTQNHVSLNEILDYVYDDIPSEAEELEDASEAIIQGL